MEKDILDYLRQGNKPSAGTVENFLWTDKKEPVEIPPMYELYCRLKLYVMRDAFGFSPGAIPFLEDGGFLEQSYINSLAIEKCIQVEKVYVNQQEINSNP